MELSDFLSEILQFKTYLSGGIGFGIGVASILVDISKDGIDLRHRIGFTGSTMTGISTGVSQETRAGPGRDVSQEVAMFPTYVVDLTAALTGFYSGRLLTSGYLKYHESLKTIVKKSVTNIFAK
jgi:hypothetical protein